MMHRLATPALALGGLFTLLKRTKERTEVDAVSVEECDMTQSETEQFTNALRQNVITHGGVLYEQLHAASQFRMLLKEKHLQNDIEGTSPRSPLQLEKAIKQLQLDEDWLWFVRWSVSHSCDESDLACEDEIIGRRPSQEQRLHHLLCKLVTKTESGFGEELLEQNILTLLFDMCTQFAQVNRQLFVDALKVLSNIVAQTRNCAVALANSEWMPRLAWMMSIDSLEENLFAEKVCVNALSVLANTGVHLGTDIYQLHRSNKEPELDIILIHGLKGGVFRTWRAKDDPNVKRTRCWPRAWLPHDIRVPIRILAIDYLSYLVHLKAETPTLAARSRRFQAQLTRAGVGQRPVVFIGHSLGGLLVKRLLLDNSELLKSTLGILFIATPHRGSPLASYARFALRPTQDVLLLRQDDATNRKLHEDFLNISSQVTVITSMAELKDSPLFMRQRGFLVPPQSAFFETGPLYHIKDIHHNICKPSGPNDNAYGVIVQFLYDAIFELEKFRRQTED